MSGSRVHLQTHSTNLQIKCIIVCIIYWKLSAQVKRACRRDKNAYYDVCRKSKPKESQEPLNRGIENEDSVLLTDRNQTAERWKNYCQ